MAKQFGVSGNMPIFGTLNTGEHVSALDGVSGRPTYDEMVRSNPQLAAVMAAVSLPVLRNDYRVEPPTDDARDAEVAEFVEDNLFNRMSMSWRDVLRHVLLMNRYGFSVFEKLFERSRDDGKVRLRKLDPRLPTSIQRWVYDGDTLDYIEQMGADGNIYKLPIENCVVFTRGREGDNWEGVSLLRPSYGMWKIANEMWKVAAIKHDRWGVGIPVATAPEGVDSTSDAWGNMEDILQGLHANELGYVVKPSGWDLQILTAGNDGKGGSDVEGFLRLLNEQMAVSVLAQFLNLGTTETGSRALGQSFIDFFLMAEQEAADYIAEIMTQFVIRPLVDYNWDVDEYPKLTAGRIREIDYETLAKLKTAGLITSDIETENTVREVLGLPEREAEEEPGPAPTPAPEEPADEPEESEEVAAHDHGHTHTFAEPPEEIREFVQFAEIDAELDVASDDLLREVLDIREQQIEQLKRQILQGKAVRNITVPAKKEMYDLLVRSFRRQVKAGREQVREEVRRQSPGFAMADPVSDEAFVELLLEELSLLVDGASDKLRSTVARMALDLQKAGYTGDALLAELDRVVPQRIGEQTWKDLVGTAVGEGWGHGRHLELVKLEGSGDVSRYQRFGILDRNLCSVCREKDQKIVTPSDPDFRVPDQECKGGPGRCRCIIVAIMRSEVPA